MEIKTETKMIGGVETLVITEVIDGSIFDIPEIDQKIIDIMKDRLRGGFKGE